jgi:sugar lactone lactonase YvrE
MNNYVFIAALVLFMGCKQSDRTEYIVAEKDLIPEGIAYSKSTDSFYLTSIYKSKIIEIDRVTGKQKDFISEKEYGFLPGEGIYIDDERSLLHAVGGYFRLQDSLTSLFTFDLDSRELIRRVDIVDGKDHFLNDLVMDKEGNLYITDTKGSAVYFLPSGGDSLSLFYQSTEIQYPNGIAISDDNTKLFIASFRKGVRSLDIEHKQILSKADTTGVSHGIDGLEFYNGNLYAIQNGVQGNPHSFRKLILNADQSEVVGLEVIDDNHERLNLPLTFCIVNNQAVVIGNSNLQYLNQTDFTLDKPDSLKSTKLLIYCPK